MFTGLIREVGIITSIRTQGETAEIQIHAPKTAQEASLGDSIAVNGSCLTVSFLDQEVFHADLSSETLRRTSFAEAHPGAAVNLEPSLRLADKLGGHLVTGHVDGVGRIESIEGEGEFCQITFSFPPRLAPYIAEKGSICIEGISLTVTFAIEEKAGVSIIPTTLRDTNLGTKNPGDTINIEVDLIARYLERLLTYKSGPSELGLTFDKLRDYGFPVD
ncbi:MAG: riboflavin synthase [bacterium]|jgi:riboflavin synthase|nr:riboflavin synthase [bacterium]